MDSALSEAFPSHSRSDDRPGFTSLGCELGGVDLPPFQADYPKSWVPGLDFHPLQSPTPSTEYLGQISNGAESPPLVSFDGYSGATGFGLTELILPIQSPILVLLMPTPFLMPLQITSPVALSVLQDFKVSQCQLIASTPSAMVTDQAAAAMGSGSMQLRSLLVYTELGVGLLDGRDAKSAVIQIPLIRAQIWLGLELSTGRLSDLQASWFTFYGSKVPMLLFVHVLGSGHADYTTALVDVRRLVESYECQLRCSQVGLSAV